MRKRIRKPYRIKKKKSIFKHRFFWQGILILIIFAQIFYLTYFCDFFQLEKIIISGQEKVLKEDIKNIVERDISKSIFLINSGKIRKNILENFPQIAEIEISKKFPNALHIIIIERFGLAHWCQTQQCFLVDAEGIIFDPVRNTISNGVEQISLLKIKPENKNKEIKLGERVINKELLEKILDIEAKLKNFVSLDKVFIISEDRLNFKTNDGWEIYFDPKKDINWQITKLDLVLAEEIPSEKRKDLEYIELRFGNFAPFKYKD